jgi:hypothetical protein
MHYCDRCDDPQLLEPHGPTAARCPQCGTLDRAAPRRPLFVVVGASGSGKTTLVTPLVRELAGTCAVFDVDWLIDPFGRQPGLDEIDWPSLRDAWLHVAHGMALNGLPTLLLAPFTPAQVESLPGRRWVGHIHWLVLDCPDDVRRSRMLARPKWRARDVDSQIAFARWLRSSLSPVVDTSAGPPRASAQVVAAWVRGILAVGGVRPPTLTTPIPRRRPPT